MPDPNSLCNGTVPSTTVSRALLLLFWLVFKHPTSRHTLAIHVFLLAEWGAGGRAAFVFNFNFWRIYIIYIFLHENNAVHGNWSNWSNWTECSATCGVGARSRERHCDNPRPAYGGRPCEGIHKDKKSCSTGEVCVGRGIINISHVRMTFNLHNRNLNAYTCI